MGKWTFGVMLLSCVLLSSGQALAQATEFSRGQTTVVVDLNTITAENNVKFVNYTEGETLNITLNYSATCNIVFSGLTLRAPRPFTPAKGKTGGTGTLISGTPLPGAPATSGSVTGDIAFSPLKPAGPKSFVVAHLNLVLGVDSDCDPTTGDADGIDESVTIGVQIKVSTASHP
jgi:hypothetical protein